MVDRSYKVTRLSLLGFGGGLVFLKMDLLYYKTWPNSTLLRKLKITRKKNAFLSKASFGVQGIVLLGGEESKEEETLSVLTEGWEG